MNFKVVIPARLGSTRLPRKVLRPIHGQPLIRYVWEAARKSGADEIIIAADELEVQRACEGFGAQVLMTAREHQSGTDRANEVAQKRGWSGDTLIVNLQGDEPLMPPALIRHAAELLAHHPGADIATLCHPLHLAEDWLNPNFVKVVMDARDRALYFSRAPIPWKRDAGGTASFPEGAAYRHIGLYAYRAEALARFSRLPVAGLETVEALEQLRALANGLTIQVGITATPPPRGVDTQEDLEVVSRTLSPLR